MHSSIHPTELIIYYDNNSNSSRQTLAYAKSMSNHVNAIPYNSGAISKTKWREVLKLLQLTPKELMNRADPKYQAQIKGHEFDTESWLNILASNTDLIKAPIAIYRNKAILCNSPTDILKL